MKKALMASLFIAVASPPIAVAGVTMDLVTKSASGTETAHMRIYAEGQKVRMDDREQGVGNSMIFLGDRFLLVDHEDKTYMVMDEAMLTEVSSQVSQAMKEMEKQLASLPPEQRAMAEQMMKGQMGGMPGQQAAPPPPRLEALGSGKWQSYDCRNYAVYEGGEKSQEVCAAPLDDVDGAEEMMTAFQGMAGFIRKMTETMPMGSDREFNPGELMDQIGGFPVHTIEFADGQVTAETMLESLLEQDLDPTLFEVPEEYVRQDPFAGR